MTDAPTDAPKMSAPDHALDLRPHPQTWTPRLRERWEQQGRSDRARRFREQLDLPTDAPIVMTGHQPIIFHPGVLAKYLAGSALAARTGAHAVWLIVDQDETDPGLLALPALDAHGGLERRLARVLDAPPNGVPAGMVSASPTRAIDEPGAPWPFVRDGLRDVERAFSANTHAPSLAAQSAGAAFDLMRPLGIAGVPLLATRLARTDLFRELLERMARDPLGFVEHYNAAAAAFPKAGIAPLNMSIVADRYELPLWRLAPETPRTRVYAEDLEAREFETLAPRALFMTLLVRLAGCDLFIHGAGGWEYDRITERLAQTWLGEDLAPMTLATATMTLPLLDTPIPTTHDAERAMWRAHHAAHDPDMLGDEQGAARKRERLAQIEAHPRRSAERRAAFRALHDLLDEIRERCADALKRFRAEAESISAAYDARAIAEDRTWPFALYPREDLCALRDTIDARFT